MSETVYLGIDLGTIVDEGLGIGRCDVDGTGYIDGDFSRGTRTGGNANDIISVGGRNRHALEALR